MLWSVVIGRKALAEAFDALVLVATTLDTAGASLKNVNVPIFSYVLTNKQFDAIKKICKQEGVPEPVHRGVLIDLNAVLHPIQARIDKDAAIRASFTPIGNPPGSRRLMLTALTTTKVCRFELSRSSGKAKGPIDPFAFTRSSA